MQNSQSGVRDSRFAITWQKQEVILLPKKILSQRSDNPRRKVIVVGVFMHRERIFSDK